MFAYPQKISLIHMAPELGPKGHKVWDIIRAMMAEAWRAGRTFVTPKNKTLARMAGCCPRTVQRAVYRLERSGLLKVTERYAIVRNQALRMSNILTMTLADLKQRVATAGAPRDKVVTPNTAILTTEKFKPSETYRLLMSKGLRHNRS